jgi:gluconolactonase
MKFDPATNEISVHCADSGQSNGLFFDDHGRLIGCCGAKGGKRAVVEIEPDGGVKVLYDTFRGKRFNSPNDLVIDAQGNIWFSDPRYAGDEPLELDLMCVYRIEPTGTIRRVTDGKTITKPNGVHISPDGKTLYVAETDNGSADVTKVPDTPPKMKMTLNAFSIERDGSLGKKTVLQDFGQETGTDGMSIDTDGNLYAAVRRDSRHGITVFSPAGKELAYIPTDDLPTNCSFGIGSEARTLYVTAGSGLYRIKLKTTGFHPTRK